MGKFGIKNIWDIQAGSNVNTDNLVTTNTTQTISAVKTFSALPQSSVAPTNANDLVNKTYADACKNGNNWTTIQNSVGHIGTVNDTWTQILDYTNMENSFRIENQGTYEVLFKQNTNSKDMYCSAIIGVNSADYDNMATSSEIFWGDLGSASIKFTISLKNNQFKLWARRSTGSTNDWNTNTRIYIRKIGANGIQ